MPFRLASPRPLIAAALCAFAVAGAHAAPTQVKVTVQNLAPQDSISFAPLHVGFNAGVFDSFNLGEMATAPIVSVAEGGSGSAWQPAFAAAACAVRWLLRERLAARSLRVLSGGLLGVGVLVASTVVATFSGWLYPVAIPAAYQLGGR